MPEDRGSSCATIDRRATVIVNARFIIGGAVSEPAALLRTFLRLRIYLSTNDASFSLPATAVIFDKRGDFDGDGNCCASRRVRADY